MSFKFALNPQAAKGMRKILLVTQYDVHARETERDRKNNKSNYSEKPGETKSNLSTQIRFFPWRLHYKVSV